MRPVNRSESCRDKSNRLFPALALVQFDQLLDRGGILWLFVSLPEGDQSWKAQRVTRLGPDFACRMGRRTRDLIGQHFEDQLRLDPHARLNERGDAGGPVIDFQPSGTLADTAPLLIAEPRADLVTVTNWSRSGS